MMPTLLYHTTPATAFSSSVSTAGSPSVRLNLDLVLGHRGAVDGTWWPCSRNAAAELPGLIAAVDERLHRVTARVTLDPDAWDGIPSHVQARGRLVEVGRSRNADPRLVRLTTTTIGYVNLLVTAPDMVSARPNDAFGTAASGEGRFRRPDMLTDREQDAAGFRVSGDPGHAVRRAEGSQTVNCASAI
ncbi:DUF5994 family protein [Streptosporangium fragile]|uniref:DUF5994 family protein n=1 Tax=Streptosporangium fragile TaxID=46186 RepID=A0ABN3VSN1_9ACTN